MAACSGAALLFLVLAKVSLAQQAGTVKEEYHPPLTLSECTDAGCVAQIKSVTLDANWRWIHDEQYQNCYDGTSWDASVCSTPEDCAAKCQVDGIPKDEWQSTYGVTSDDSTGLSLGYETDSAVGSRMYVLDNETHYKMFKLLNKEISFDVDASGLPCGLNGALYLSEMMADGGSSEFAGNNAGAKLGTGYCDAQCPQDIKFINGEANMVDWDSTTGTGKYGACCAEMDIWEANSQATAYTPHPCSLEGPSRCESSDDCGEDGFCDKAGCDLNTYRFGDTTFFGNTSSFSVDTAKAFTVITQFITSDGTDSGDLVEIRRKYVQDGKTISSPDLVLGGDTYTSISNDFCTAQKSATGDTNQFAIRGGLKEMGEAMRRGMVLVMSIWDDAAAHMLWLDSTYPVDSSATGAKRGSCATSSGEPSETREAYSNSYVKFSNIKFGVIGSTSSDTLTERVKADIHV